MRDNSSAVARRDENDVARLVRVQSAAVGDKGDAQKGGKIAPQRVGGPRSYLRALAGSPAGAIKQSGNTGGGKPARRVPPAADGEKPVDHGAPKRWRFPKKPRQSPGLGKRRRGGPVGW